MFNGDKTLLDVKYTRSNNYIAGTSHKLIYAIIPPLPPPHRPPPPPPPPKETKFLVLYKGINLHVHSSVLISLTSTLSKRMNHTYDTLQYTVYNLRMCIKEDNPNPKYIKGDNYLCKLGIFFVI